MVGCRGYTVIAKVANSVAAYHKVVKRLVEGPPRTRWVEEPPVSSSQLMAQKAACPCKRLQRSRSHQRNHPLSSCLLGLTRTSRCPLLVIAHTARPYKAIPVQSSAPRHQSPASLMLVPPPSYTPSIPRGLAARKTCRYVEGKVGATMGHCVSRAEKAFARVRCDVKAVSRVPLIAALEWYRSNGGALAMVKRE